MLTVKANSIYYGKFKIIDDLAVGEVFTFIVVLACWMIFYLLLYMFSGVFVWSFNLFSKVFQLYDWEVVLTTAEFSKAPK